MNNKFFPNKNLSQNFLIDKKIIFEIVNLINPKYNDFIVEIGPGLGALTYPVSKKVKKLFVIEYDKILGLKLCNSFKNIEVIIQDVLKFNFFNLIKKIDKSIRIFGNLPYNISVILLFYLFQLNGKIQDMHFTVQHEVAKRLFATPGTKDYGRLSIIAQYYCNISLLLNILPKSFRPIPKINSTFVRLTPLTVPNFYLKDIKKLSYITKLAFSQRRKMLKNSLSLLFSENLLKKLGVNPSLRAENVSIKQYCLLSNYIS